MGVDDTMTREELTEELNIIELEISGNKKSMRSMQNRLTLASNTTDSMLKMSKREVERQIKLLSLVNFCNTGKFL